ncbi:hypothetical protein BGZ72_008559 [Mortierella alpina]|nr:hypothetical protein BGZ72_008559 [Mortierella alpina]
MLRAEKQPQLPTECLALILENLWDDLPSLHSLLCCSQTFFHLTVPVLYREPFGLIDRQDTWSGDKKTRKTAYLMRILCACARTCPSQSQKLLDPQGDTQANSSFLVASLAEASTSATIPTPTTTAVASSGLYADARNFLSAAIQTASSSANANTTASTTSSSAVAFSPALPTALSLPLTIDYLYYYTHQGRIPRSFFAFQRLEDVGKGVKSIDSTLPSSWRPYIYQDRSVYESAFSRASLSFTLTMVGHYPSRIRVLSMTPSQLGYIVRKTHSKSIPSMASLSGDLGEGGLQSSCGVESFRMLRRLELDFGATNTPRARLGDSMVGQDAEDDDDVDYPLQFILEHQRLFVETISTAASPTTSTVSGASGNQTVLGHDLLRDDGGSQAFKSNEVPLLQELVIRGSHATWSPGNILTKVEPLQVIDLSAWNSSVPHLGQIPRTRLRSLKTNIARRLAFVEIQIPFLRRCSQLEEVWLPAQSPLTFRWAIDTSRDIGKFVTASRLKRRHYWDQPPDNNNESPVDDVDGAHHDDGTVQQHQQQEQQQQPGSEGQQVESNTQEALEYRDNQLALKRIRLYGSPWDLVESLEDAADAFRDSLEEMAGYEDGYGRRDEYPRMCISWPVPRLTTLHLRGRFVYFFDLSSLRHCPDLKVCWLQIESNFTTGPSGKSEERYAPKDFAVFAGMKRLQVLQLRGSSWGINNEVLEVLKFGYREGDGHSLLGTESEAATGTGSEFGAVSYLPENLQFFSMAESHEPTRAGLVAFVQRMRKLRVIQLGTTYSYAQESVREAGGSRLFVEVNVTD